MRIQGRTRDQYTTGPNYGGEVPSALLPDPTDADKLFRRRLSNHLSHTVRSKTPLPNRRRHCEDRQVHGNDDKADRDAEEYHHHRLE